MKKIALIGYGYWGPNLLRNLFDTPGCEPVVCCDLSTERLELAKRRYPTIEVTTDINKVLGNKTIDGVVIATPTRFHHEVAKKALLNNKHVLIEKPMALNLVQAKELVALGEKKGKVVMVDHTFLFNDAVTKIKKIISNGELGDIVYIDSVRANLGLFQHDINVIYDLAAHDFSIINFLLDQKPLSIHATGKSHYNKQEDVAYIHAQYPKNIDVHLHVSWLSPLKIRRMSIVGTRKMILYDDNEPAEKIKIYDKGVTVDMDPLSAEQVRIGYRSGDAWLPNINFIEPLGIMLKAFVNAMKKYQLNTLSAGQFALEVMEDLEAATKSVRTGKIVKLK